MNKKTIFKALSVLLSLLIWQIVSILVGAEYLLASPIKVIRTLFELIFEKQFLSTILFSLFRIGGGFLLAFLIGLIFAVISGKYKVFEYLLWPIVTAVKSVPIASFIILFLIWLSPVQITVYVVFLIAFPLIYTNVLQGVKNVNRNLSEVADIYHIPFKKRLLYIYIPSIRPFLILATSVGIGMSWKAGVAAEVIGVVSGSIGEKLYNAKIYFQNSELLAWTIVIIVLSILCEKIFVFLLKKIFSGIFSL